MSSEDAKTTDAYITFTQLLINCLKRRGIRRQLYIRDLQLHVEHTIQDFLNEKSRREVLHAEQLANTIKGTEAKMAALKKMNLQFTRMVNKLTQENTELEKQIQTVAKSASENAKLRETQQSTQK